MSLSRIRPVWGVFAFVSSSIVVAGAYHAWTLSQYEKTQFVKAIPANRIPAEAEAGVSPRATPPSVWQSLHRIFSGEGNACPSPRFSEDSTVVDAWNQLPLSFRSQRQRLSGEFQISCLQESNRANDARAGRRNCDRVNCVSSEEMLVTYNALLDLTDCFELSPSEFVPLVASLSGPSWSLMAADGEANSETGLGLLRSQDALEYVKISKELATNLKQNTKSSCQRLTSLFPDGVIGKLAERTQTGTCAPAIPQRSLQVILAAAERMNRVTIDVRERWEREELDGALAELDARMEDRMALHYWTHLVAYFESPEVAVAAVKGFIEQRRTDDARIEAGELAWTEDPSRPADRAPANVNSQQLEEKTRWLQKLAARVSPETQAKLARLQDWLAWVRLQKRGVACASDLWISDL